jgi:hypothetical protein
MKDDANDFGWVLPVADWLRRAAARPHHSHSSRFQQAGESLTQCLATVHIVALTCKIVRQAVIDDLSNLGAMTNISYRLNASTEVP